MGSCGNGGNGMAASVKGPAAVTSVLEGEIVSFIAAGLRWGTVAKETG